MRNLCLVAVLAWIPVSHCQAAAYLERQPAEEVQLEQLLHAPQAYMNMRVKFRCVYVEQGDLYDPIHTQYSTESYINVVGWDDDARIWEPQVRSKPVASMYFAKDRVAKSQFGELKKYDLVDITGEVTSAFRKQPWVTIHTIQRVEDAGRFTDSAIWHLEQAAALGDEGARDLAEIQYEAAFADDLPLYGRVLVGELRARNAIAAGRHGHAAKLIERALELSTSDDLKTTVSDKDRASLHYLMARVGNEMAAAEVGDHSRKERYADAAKNARRAIDLDPKQGDFYAVLGIAAAGLGDFDEARKQCALAIRMQPNNAETRWYLGRILDQQGQHDEAIDALKKAIDLTPKDARMHAAIADAYRNRSGKGGPTSGSDIATALREYDIAIRLKPNDPELLLASGRAMEAAVEAKADVTVGSAKQPATREMAIERYKAAAAANPEHLGTHLSLAKAYQAAGNTAAAADHLAKATDLDPKDASRMAEVARFYETMDRKEDALAMWERTAKADPKNADAWYSVGHLSLALGNGDRAKTALERAVDLRPKHVAALCDLAELHLAAGEPKPARKRADAAASAARTPEDKERAAAIRARVDEAAR